MESNTTTTLAILMDGRGDQLVVLLWRSNTGPCEEDHMKTVRPPFDAQGLTERLEGRLKTLDADDLKSVATRMMETMRNDPRWRVTNGTADVCPCSKTAC